MNNQSGYFAQKRLSIFEWLYFSKKCFFPSRSCFYRGEKWGRDKKRSIEPAKISAGNTLVTSHGWQHRSDFLPKKRNTKSLSGWKLKSTSTEKLIIQWETRTKALHVIKHMVCITTFSQRHRGVCAKHAGSLINHKGIGMDCSLVDASTVIIHDYPGLTAWT